MRIVAGAWRGRRLTAPLGVATRPTADRVRQALFDMLLHAPWGGRHAVAGGAVLDAFAGTGALGLEALSRGAAHATFLERDRAALAALRANIGSCGAASRARVIEADATRPPLPPPPGTPCTLVFLDPPYGQGLAERALPALKEAGWLAPAALLVIESARDEAATSPGTALAERAHGAACLRVFRLD